MSGDEVGRSGAVLDPVVGEIAAPEAAAVRRRRVLIVANPAAGRAGSARRRLARTVAALERRGCAVELRRGGVESGGVERLAREAEPEFEAVVAAGGDGTVNAAANGLAAMPRPMAVLPFGTANVLARAVGLPRDPEALAELIVAGEAQPIWPGTVGDRLFLAMASSGFDAEIVAAVNPRLKRRLGRGAFACAMAARFARYRHQELHVRVDGAEYRASTLIATTGRFYAGPFVIAPAADPAERILDLLLFARAGRVAGLRYLGALVIGRIAQRRDIVFLRAREALLSSAEPVSVQADGEPLGTLPVRIAIADRPIPLIRPRRLLPGC